MSAAISSLVTPFSRARPMCDRSWSGRFSAMSALTVTRLRSRCDSAESGQTSPYNTRFVISASFGANSFIARGVTDGRALSPATPGGREGIAAAARADRREVLRVRHGLHPLHAPAVDCLGDGEVRHRCVG